MKILQKIAIITVLIYSITLFGCEKFLAKKANDNLAIPEKLENFQALLDNVIRINAGGPLAGEISSDDYVFTNQQFDALSEESEKRMHIWEKEYVFTSGYNNWKSSYFAIYSANTALKGLEGISRTNQNASKWDNVKGHALFTRGSYLLDAAIVWCLAYDDVSATKDLGLPLRSNTDFNEVSVRSNVQQTYDQIIADLKEAATLLPSVPISKYRPSKTAAYGYLARTYLAMRKYPEAEAYADAYLALKSDMLDFNNLNLNVRFPIDFETNNEVVYYKGMESASILSPANVNVPREVFDLFLADDLRKKAFFKLNADGSYNFTGGYSGSNGKFSAVATNEIYLTKAECLARANKYEESIALLNTLVLKRWDKNAVYVPYHADNKDEALVLIFKERRKELIMRGTRWMDIKRLNKESANISLKRTYHGRDYTLPANDLRFALPIPEDVIALSGMEQNPRL